MNEKSATCLRLIQIDGTEDPHALEADLGQVTPSVTLGTTVPRSSFLMSLHLLPGPVEDPGAILFFFAGDPDLYYS